MQPPVYLNTDDHHNHRGATLDVDPISPSLKQRVKLALRLPFCFRGRHQYNEDDGYPSTDVPLHGDSQTPPAGLPRSTYSSAFVLPNSPLKYHHRHDHSGEIREKHRSHAKSRLGRHKRRHSMGDFQYDALSYSLNFEEDGVNESSNAADLHFRSFSTRLPATVSPPDTLNGLT